MSLEFTATGVRATCTSCRISVEITYARSEGCKMPSYTADILAPLFINHRHGKVVQRGDQQAVA